MSKWYGNIMNRLEEDRQFCTEIEVGTGMTEYFWSDRHAYEVVAVKDQKHVSVREYGHRHIGEGFQNDWELFPDETNPVRDLEKRGKYWYWVSVAAVDDLPDEGDVEASIRFIMAGFDPEVVKAKGKQVKRSRAKVSFGKADYYYDYEF